MISRMPMDQRGMEKQSKHLNMGTMEDPPSTVPRMAGKGPFGALDLVGMFTVLKVRDELAAGNYRDPGWYQHPAGSVAKRVSTDPDFGTPPRHPA